MASLLFIATTTITVLCSDSMAAMPGMPMPAGWKMSMTWMRMPGQRWPAAAASFLGMWIVMMITMMLPSLVSMPQRYRQAIRGATEARLNWLTALVGAGYFFVWMVVGMAIFPLGVTLAGIEMLQPAVARAVPTAVGVVVLIAGAFQFSAWKVHYLGGCLAESDGCRRLPTDTRTAWRHGLRYGVHCSYSCANWTAILLVIGITDLCAMTVITAAITANASCQPVGVSRGRWARLPLPLVCY